MNESKNKCEQHENPKRCSYPHCGCHPTTIGMLIKRALRSIKNSLK